MKPEVTIILGPTASGKTNYAIELAKQRPSLIISADSRQVYAGMNIGTAKPEEAWSSEPHSPMTPDSVQGIDHYLFNVRTPDAPLTLAEWQSMAQDALRLALEHDLHPIIVGGTMLYVDSIVHNYTLPQVAPDQTLRAQLEKEPVEDLYSQLIEQDPSAQSFIAPGNKRRIVRALEVIKATGKPFSTLRAQQPSLYSFTLIGLFPGWEELKERIQTRHAAMFANGLIEETEELRNRYTPSVPLLATLNYLQAGKVLDNTLSLPEAVEENIRVNMRYARRQMSWWRGREEIRWID
ncbi:MAG: tRNA (adenosine(37)-N6)-dimethylallyltransferase MiaA [Candidatus Andersenbacteria bacterium]